MLPRKRTPELFVEPEAFKKRVQACREVIRDIQQGIEVALKTGEAARSLVDALQTAVKQKSPPFAKQVGIPESLYIPKALDVLKEGFAVLPAQKAATVELQRYVGILESLLNSADFSQAEAAVTDGEAAIRIGRSFLAKSVIEMPEAADFRGACPGGMWGFTDAEHGALCCPEQPRNGQCVQRRAGLRYMCAPESNTEAVRNGQVPVCVPDPQQGPCLPDYFFYGRTVGGGCCPVKPTGYDPRTKDFATCPQLVSRGDVPRAACALTPNTPLAKMLPRCVEGFQTYVEQTMALDAADLRGKDLLDYTDDLFDIANKFIVRVQTTSVELEDVHGQLSKRADSLVFRVGPAPAPAPAPTPVPSEFPASQK